MTQRATCSVGKPLGRGGIITSFVGRRPWGCAINRCRYALLSEFALASAAAAGQTATRQGAASDDPGLERDPKKGPRTDQGLVKTFPNLAIHNKTTKKQWQHDPKTKNNTRTHCKENIKNIGKRTKNGPGLFFCKTEEKSKVKKCDWLGCQFFVNGQLAQTFGVSFFDPCQDHIQFSLETRGSLRGAGRSWTKRQLQRAAHNFLRLKVLRFRDQGVTVLRVNGFTVLGFEGF